MSEDVGRIRVDLEDLMEAMQNHSYEITWLLDLQTGDMILAGDGMVNGEDCDLDDFLDKEPDRYRIIESIDSSQGYRVMEGFIDNLRSRHAQDVLRQAIERSKPFRNFKDALIDLGEVQEQWFDYEKQAYKKFAEEWLESEEIDAEVVYQRDSSKP